MRQQSSGQTQYGGMKGSILGTIWKLVPFRVEHLKPATESTVVKGRLLWIQ